MESVSWVYTSCRINCEREPQAQYHPSAYPVSYRATTFSAGLTACTKQPIEQIVPYTTPPEEGIPGKPLFFGTGFSLAGYGIGVLAESHEGRPTKMEGNPNHPASRGATDVFTQASVLNLYDVDRSQTVRISRSL